MFRAQIGHKIIVDYIASEITHHEFIVETYTV